jgi:hypothetical protein
LTAGEEHKQVLARTHDSTSKGDRLSKCNLCEKILVIEWFPYASETWFYTAEKYEKARNSLCPSQDYRFQLALSFVDDPQVIVLGMRSKRYWVAVDKRFERIPFLNSCQKHSYHPEEHGTRFIRQDCQTDYGVARLLPEHLTYAAWLAKKSSRRTHDE